MFGKEKPPERNGPSDVVDSFGDTAIKYALTGEWVTLALSHFETSFTTRYERDHWEQGFAVGYVHFEWGATKQLRTRLTLSESPADVVRGQIGQASFNYMNGEEPHAIFEVYVDDVRGKIARSLRAAFDSAALSQNRYVHVRLRRPKLDAERIIADLKEHLHGGSHPITELDFKHKTTLVQAPARSWTWHL